MWPLTGCAVQLMDGMAERCALCQKQLCLRQQVLNLALGEEKHLLCLSCLAADNDTGAEELLTRLAAYVRGRDCFLKEWRRYTGLKDCPSPDTCLPNVCFEKELP
ncbi:MAG: hypothetical protein JNN26_05740 [Candidatus Obscuribacter sp.]|nr:hypothetical protein [Candidatus Obscuribacter sp.]